MELPPEATHRLERCMFETHECAVRVVVSRNGMSEEQLIQLLRAIHPRIRLPTPESDETRLGARHCLARIAGRSLDVGSPRTWVVSAEQLVSVAASLIPFLKTTTRTAHLMGSNMQRQSVPCFGRKLHISAGMGAKLPHAIQRGSRCKARRSG